ncbi:hypothetical protein G5V58_23870 [Nocardioides anomalus]|uniref:Uncharacterized protein n=1 Tax=Nocardioides anomalus TaxID=2712223 RepID=A0A6G6WJG5_9ACTN|nr:hypothetical protein [Nocardioides anomalus]QIG45384.1 hypothetical protein G5V58_23870 [Nocardioides anomalus]
MWWRALGVAVVLLAVGVAGGYAVGQRAEPERRSAADPAPLPASPLPTPEQFEVLPDPDDPALEPGLPGEVRDLRLTKRGAGVSIQAPVGWTENKQPNSDTWTYIATNVSNTYSLRVNVLIGQHQSPEVAKTARVTALESSEADENLQDLQFTAETADSLEATYIFEGHRKVTAERFVGDDNNIAIADIAVTGRVVDTEGIRDLLAKVADSVTYLEPVPEGEKP